MELNTWLKNINSEFNSQNIPYRQRPMEAARRYALEFNSSISFDSEIMELIWDWFKSRSKPETYQIGNLFESAYFYDGQLWKIEIAIGFGEIAVNPFKSLTDMPSLLMHEINNQPIEYRIFSEFWANCLDYAYGMDDLLKSSNKAKCNFLIAADQELRMITALLSKGNEKDRTLLSCRMALEMFLKGYIDFKIGLSDKEAKKLNHNLHEALEKYIEVSGKTKWKQKVNHLDLFPNVAERYTRIECNINNLWEAFSLIQTLAAEILREFTGRNILEAVQIANK